MKQLKDYYDTLNIDRNATSFNGFLHRGILRLKSIDDINKKDSKGKPYYVVEVTGSLEENDLVAVTKAKPEVDSKGNPVLNKNGLWAGYKNYTVKKVDMLAKDVKDIVGTDSPSKYSDGSVVSRITREYKDALEKTIKKELKKENKIYTHEVKVYDEPLYVTNLEYGEDTLTGEVGLGFKDYETVVERGVNYRGKPTGVFICLSDLDWLPTKVDSEELIKYAKNLSDAAENKHDYFRLPW